MATILVTGGAGFLGSHVVDRLLELGHYVRVLDAQPNRTSATSKRRAKMFVGDITALPDVMLAAEGCDGIVHLAAISRVADGVRQPFRCIDVNVTGTAAILEAARLGVNKPWVVVGSTRETPSRLRQSKPLGFYGLTKHFSNQIAEAYARDHGLRVQVLRFADIYGSLRDNRGKVFMTFVERALNGAKLEVKDTSALFDFIHQQDVVTAIVKSGDYLDAAREASFDMLSVATGRVVTLDELARIIKSETRSTSTVHLDGAKKKAVSRTERAKRIDASPWRARKCLGFRAAIDLETGIRRLADEIQAENKSKSGTGVVK